MKYRKIALASLFILLTLVILTMSVDRHRDLAAPEKVAIEVLAPAQKAVWNSFDFFVDIGRRYFYLVETAKENARLRQEVAQLRQELILYQQDHLANQRLRALLEFKERSPLPVVAAEVVASDPSGWFKTILVDKGSADGVGRGMAVINAEGVVGRVIEVGYHHCLVILLTDRNFGVDALIQRSRERGILKGSPEGVCRLDFVIRNADVVPGDIVVTAGLAGAFPKGLILGQVKRVERRASEPGMFQTIEIQPAVDLDRLEEVLIVLKENPFFSEVGRGPAG